MSLPMRLDKCDTLTLGCIIRHQTKDFNAVILDYTTIKGREKGIKGRETGYIAAKLVIEEEDLSSEFLKLSDYIIFFIPNRKLKNWMLLYHSSQEYCLGEGE